MAAAAGAAALRIRDATGAADLQARLDHKARLAGRALELAGQAIADQPTAGRSFGHRLIAAVLLDLAADLEPLGLSDRVRRYRDEAAVSLRRCASFDEPPDVQASCREQLASLERDDPATVLARHRDGLERCVRGAGLRWEGTLRISVGEGGVEAIVLDPPPAEPLPACLGAWGRSLPLRGPVDVELPLSVRPAE